MGRRAGERGATAILVSVFVSTVALVAVAWVAEYGLAFSNKRFLQNAVDAAALAAATHVRDHAPVGLACEELKGAIEVGGEAAWDPDGLTTTESVAATFFTENLGSTEGVVLDGVRATCEPATGLTITVEARQTAQTPFGEAAGTDMLRVRTSATAAVGTPAEVIGLRPIALCLVRAQAAAKDPGVEYGYPLQEKGDEVCGLDQSVWGLLNFDGSRGNGGSDGAVSDIVSGHPKPVGSSTADHDVWIDGSPGLRRNLVRYIEDLVGDEIVLPVYDSYRSHGKDFRIVGFITVQITAVTDDEIRMVHRRFSPVAQINPSCLLGEASCDLGARVVQLAG